MTALTISRESSDLVKVHNNKAVQQLVKDDRASTRLAMPVGRRIQKRPHSTATCRRGLSHAPEDSLLTEWLNNKTVGSLQGKTDLEIRETRKMYDSVLDTEDTFVKKMEELVDHKDTLELRKREILYKKWTDRVYEPLHRQVTGQVNGPGYPELQWRKRQLHKEYLEFVNRKGHVFLDIISPEEYYAIGLNPSRPGMLVAETSPLNDPLLLQDSNRQVEDRTIYRCAHGAVLDAQALATLRLPPLPLVPLGRHGTKCCTWLEMPMGDIESPVRMASSGRVVQNPDQYIETMRPFRRRMVPSNNESHFNLEKWGERVDQNIIDMEMRIQKKRQVAQKNRLPVRTKPAVVDAAVQVDCA